MGIKLSACTIVKNEELNIGKSIDSYKEYVDEIIVVDTGSLDKTKEIAVVKGAKVFDFEWKNDFAAAKNFALDNASGDWIIFLDADEWFDGDSAKNIQEAINRAIAQGYDAVACKLVNFYTEKDIMETASTIRVFKHTDNVRFKRAIHEVLFDISKDIALPGIFSELFTVNHSGYMKELIKKKARRNKTLLDKNFAFGNASYIDYFYGMRENLSENPEMAEFFYKLIENTPNYDDLISSYNISTSVDENKFKVVNYFPGKYSFEYRVKLLESIEEKYPTNPLFKFYEYKLFSSIDKKRAIIALQDAVKFDKDFEKNNLASNNPFYSKRSEANELLGDYYIFVNDKINALEHFTNSLKNDYMNFKALCGMLYAVSGEKSEDIILFLNSIFDISSKEVEKYLVDALRTTKYKDVFLYYFVDYYKKFEEVERAYFTSRLITENYDEVIDKYIDIYKESKDEKALLFIVAALIMANSKERFCDVASYMPYKYTKILNLYFDECFDVQFTEEDFYILVGIFKELAYIADSKVVVHLADMCGYAKERFYYEVFKYYYSQYSYEYVLEFSDKLENDAEFSDKLIAYVDFLKTNIYFRNSDFENLSDYLEKTISKGYLDEDIVFICEMLEADDEKLKEYFDLLESLNFANKNMMLESITDTVNDSVKFMTVDKFNEEVKNKKVLLLDEYADIFLNFAGKAEGFRAFSIAEKYYKLLVKYDYKTDIAYYKLGRIYNYFEKPELSYFCYENAFIENLALAKSILPEKHINSNYVFSKREEIERNVCPVCGGSSSLFRVYTNIDDVNLSYNEPVIVKYRKCDACGHVFAGNDLVNKDYWEKGINKNFSDDRISLCYDILENICEMTDGDIVLDCSKDNGEFRTAASNYGFVVCDDAENKKFDVIFIDNLLNNVSEPQSMLEKCIENMAQDCVVIFEIYDEGNAYSKLRDKPLWAKAGVKNIFSKQSVDGLLANLDLHILQINVDKINKGKIIVFAGR